MNSWKGLHEALAVASVTSSFSTAGPSMQAVKQSPIFGW
jgi:hypothetical protein